MSLRAANLFLRHLNVSRSRCECFFIAGGITRRNATLTTLQIQRIMSTSTKSPNPNPNPTEESRMNIPSVDVPGTNEAKSDSETSAVTPLTARQRLRAAIRDYGSGVLVFHIASGVTFLSMWYLLVSRFTQGAGTFAVAYAIHKATAPLRIALTLTVAPLIVNYLRRKGILQLKKKLP